MPFPSILSQLSKKLALLRSVLPLNQYCIKYSSCKGQAGTMKILNVAEKNDAAKNIANHLGGGNTRRREGLSKFNKIYEFEYNVRGQNATMVMTSVSGHLLTHDFAGQYKNWRGCSPLALFDAPVIKFCPPDYENIKKTLEREVRSCQMLIIWTDCDREGENIGYEIIKVCQDVKPNLQVLRARFSEITGPSIRRAINTLEPPNQLVSDAVEVRSELDLRIGAAFTRFQTLRLQQVFPENLKEQLISYGSCQFPTLGFVVERYKAIERFIPEPFWKILVSHTIDDLTVNFSWKRVRLFDELACQVLLDTIQEQPEAVVEKVVSKPKSKWRPVPLDTIELEKLGSKKLKINAKETMRVAERLYTQGFISYPRTETNIFPKNMNLAQLVEMQTPDNRWGAFAQNVLHDGPNPRQGKKSDEAHPPIHPTKYTQGLQGNEAKVYEFIVRHFLACCSKDAQGHETIVDIDVNGEKFVASGLRIIARNYLDVYPYENWKAKEIHSYEEGQRFHPSTVDMGESQTEAPKPLTEADLIALMEKHGIGTDATHADHIETIKNRSYVGLEGINFLPGKLGLGLVDGYDSMGFAMSKPNLRAELEADLQRIADGTRNAGEVLAEQLRNYRAVFERALEQASKIDVALSQYLGEARQPAVDAVVQMNHKKVCACPLCQQDMVLKQKQNGPGFFISCMGFPDCRTAIWFPSSVENVEVLDQTCNNCNTRPQKIRFRFRRGAYQPFFPDNYESCVGGCDNDLMETLEIRPLRDLANRNPPGDTRGTNTRGNSNNGVSGSRTLSANSSATRGGGSFNTGIQQTNTSTRGNFASGSVGSTRPVPAPTPAPAPRNNNQFRDGDAVVCQCNVDALQLTVRKEGPNQGRAFYKCGNNSTCNFFLWADEDRAPPPRPDRNSHQTTLSNFGNANNRFDSGGGDEGEIVCTCGEPARSLTVQKEGPNKGRVFYACPKPRDSQCKFFQWADDESGGSSSGRGGWNGGGGGRGGGRSRGGGWSDGAGSSSSSSRGRGRGSSAGGTKGKRKCGNCGQEGHMRPKCPNL